MDTTALAERLLEACRMPDGSELPDHAEPWGADVATLREAATRLRAVAGEPVAWMFQHDETGRMTICPNDGVNTPKVFAELNPRYALIEPLYTRPQPATPASDGDGESALWALRQILHDLPIRRDWLDPDVERVARGLVERSPFADLTTPNPEQPGADR